MIATIEQAQDEMFAVVKSFWDAEVTAPTTVIWVGSVGQRPRESPTGTLQSYAKVRINHAHAFQSALSNRGGAHRYTATGMLIIQLFFPASRGNSEISPFAALLQTALRGVRTEHGVILRNVRYLEQGEQGPWFTANVLADFEYDQVSY